MDEAARRQSVGWVGGDEWDVHKDTISDLYQTQNLPLKDVMKAMEDRHGFRATQRMYKTRIKSWGLDKNFKECEVVELYRLRRERERAGKTSSRYTLRGREVDWDRVQNYVRRKGLNISQLLAGNTTAPLARDITCTTPPPSSGSLADDGAGDGNQHERHVQVSSPSCSSPSPSQQSVGSSQESGHPVPASARKSPKRHQQLTPISPVTVNGLLNNATTAHHPPPRRPPPPLLPKPSPHRRASYPLPPPRTTAPLHLHHNQFHQLPPLSHATNLGYQSTRPAFPDPLAVQIETETTLLESFQLFLTKLYKNTMFQDGDKAWGTTEYWLRNTRSLEWFMGIRYQLALHREEIFFSSAPPPSGRLKQFQTLNRAFAILEPLSKGIIASRTWYVVNFLTGFMSLPEEVASKGHNLLQNTIGKMMGEIHKGCGQRAPGPLSPTAPGGLMALKVEEARRSSTVCNDEIDRMDLDDDYDEHSHPGLDSDGGRKKGWFVDGNAGFQETGNRFLMEVLGRMFTDMMASGPGSGLSLAMEAALLLEEDRSGFPICRDDRRPRGSLSRMSISSVSSSWQAALLSPVSPAEGTSAAEMLASAVRLLSREEDAKAEGQLRALIESIEQQQGGAKTTRLHPPSSPSTTLGLGSTVTEHPTSGAGVGAAQARALVRCAHYHLSKIYRRRGQREAASEHLRLAVEGSLLFDEFVGWEDVEFLFV